MSKYYLSLNREVNIMTPKELMEYASKNNVEIVDMKFMDIPGLWQHFAMPFSHLTEDSFEEGFGFDGSSIRGFQTIEESDMLLIPDPKSAFLDPFSKRTQLNLICNIKDPVTLEPYSRDVRYVAQKAENYMKSIGLADTCYIGPEAEFYILDDVRFEQTPNKAFYQVDSVEGFWNSAREENPNLGYKPRYKEGYFPVPPMDSYQDLRSEMVMVLNGLGITTEVQHHEVGTAGQAEIDLKYDTLLTMADKLIKYKYVIKNLAFQHGKTVTFMPKPIFMDNGSGMHIHVSLWKDDKNLFYQPGAYGDISEMALHFIGGILKHTPSILAFAAPTTNSYRRLVPGYEAPINLIYSQRNRSAAVRIPMYSKSENAKRVEYRCPDPSCNPYLAFSALLMAGLDGIENKITPPDPIDKDLYDLPSEEKAAVKSTPGSLEEALNALEADHQYLMKGDVFTEDLIQEWLKYKRIKEVDQIKLRPHPWEFALYYDI